MTRRGGVQWIVALACAAGLVGAPEGRAQAPDTLTIGISQFPSTLHPGIDPMMAKSYVLHTAIRPITAYDPGWNLGCIVCVILPTVGNGMAERIALEEDKRGADGHTEGMAVTLTIDPTLTWGDGTPVSAADLVFAWEVGRHPETGFAAATGFRRTLSMEPIDSHTVRAVLDRVSFKYNDWSSLYPLPAHLERPVFEADPAAYPAATLYVTNPTNPGLYFGPYRVSEVSQGSHIVLVRNSNWQGPEPAFRRLIVRTVPNSATLEANLLSGAVDMIPGEVGLSLDQALRFESRYGRRFQVTYRPSLIYEHLEVNHDSPILADLRVRQALLHATDRAAINAQLFDGRQPVAHSSINPLDTVHSVDTPTYPYDPERARALLEEAGWRLGPDGVRVNAEGGRLTLDMVTTAGEQVRELVQQVLQSQWADVGIELAIRGEPARVLFGETVRKRQFDHLALFAWISSPESVPVTTLRSDQIPTTANGWAGQNYGGYVNPRMDALLDRIELELDPDARQKLWADLQALYAVDLPALPLYFRARAHVLPRWLEGVEPTGHQFPTTLRVEHWRPAADGGT